MKSQNLSDAQWQKIEKYLPDTKRIRKHSLPEVIDAIFYVLKTGCQWRLLPCCYSKWELVYYYFSKWRDNDLLLHINDMLREYICRKHHRNSQCSAVIIDSQSVKTTRKGGFRGTNGNKKIKGRKRHLTVDIMGKIVNNIVHPANFHDSKAAYLVIKDLRENQHGIKVIYADGGYKGENFRRLSKDFEFLLQSNQAMIYLASIKLLLNKI